MYFNVFKCVISTATALQEPQVPGTGIGYEVLQRIEQRVKELTGVESQESRVQSQKKSGEHGRRNRKNKHKKQEQRPSQSFAPTVYRGT